jgi:hypothetical protein
LFLPVLMSTSSLAGRVTNNTEPAPPSPLCSRSSSVYALRFPFTLGILLLASPLSQPAFSRNNRYCAPRLMEWINVGKEGPKKQAKVPIQRFRRNPTASDVGELAKRIWKRPKFRVLQTSRATEFVFRLRFNIHKKIRKKQLASYLLLFKRYGDRRNQKTLRRALKQAYRSGHYASVRLRDQADRVLFRVLVEALTILFEEAKQSPPYKGFLTDDIKAVLEAAKRKRRPPDSERGPRAKRMAQRYNELLPKVRLLRQFVGGHAQRSNEVILREAVKRNFPDEWIQAVISGAALKSLPEIPGRSESNVTLGGLNWTPRQLTVGIIRCEEHERDSMFSVTPNTILEDYLPLGRKLNTKTN